MDITTISRLWGIVRGSIAHLKQYLTLLELNSSDHSALQRMKVKLNLLDIDFRNYHFAIINITEEMLKKLNKQYSMNMTTE